jgi:hypothetical protein
VAALWLAGLPLPLKCLGTLLLAVRWAALRPEAPPALVRRADGCWDAPSRGLSGLVTGPRTRYTRWWSQLELVGEERSLDVLLLADQFDPDAWSNLLAGLRRGAAGAASKPTGPEPPVLR